VIVTDSVPSFRLPRSAAMRAKLAMASAAPLFGQAIAASHAAWWR
jgi:hypothetical protein